VLRRRLRLRPLSGAGRAGATAVHDVDAEAATGAVARALAATLRPGDVVYLRGDVGAGKTTFVRHACVALGVRERVTSPTFAVAHGYRGRDGLAVSHLDLYRSAGLTDEEATDVEEYLGDDAIVFVEWAAHGGPRLPAATVVVDLEHAGGTRRRIAVARRDA
jgi:tRNA threonylcarbamoyladenosine biosynthesis protein TsaE